jgi:hypothetical protein
VYKLFFTLVLTSSLLFGELYKVENFETDIFSKKGNRLEKIDMTLMFDGENLSSNDYKLLDALNIIVSSFYIEDLFTSKGKERFKALLKKFLMKKYMLDIDFIYIIKLERKPQIDSKSLLEELKKLQGTLKRREVKKPALSEEEKAFEMME